MPYADEVNQHNGARDELEKTNDQVVRVKANALEEYVYLFPTWKWSETRLGTGCIGHFQISVFLFLGFLGFLGGRVYPKCFDRVADNHLGDTTDNEQRRFVYAVNAIELKDTYRHDCVGD